MNKLTHLNNTGAARQVDISNKPDSQRTATAAAHICMSAEALEAIQAGNNKKGDVLSTARLAGIMAAKKTAELIPLCHSLPLSLIEIDFALSAAAAPAPATIAITARVATTAKTGVEMEALVAASVAALTLYDMAKALDKSMVIEKTMLLEKTGGTSGDYKRLSPTPAP